jgi:dCMP deaminase
MGIAILSSERSKDPSTRVGACIVNSDNKILSMGYNGAPTGLSDDIMPWDREGDNLKTKYPYVCHSELNAILNCPTSVKGAKVYVTLFPCNECAKAIIQSGIKEVIYLSDKYHDSDGCRASRMMFDNCGVTYRKYEMAGKDIVISL